MQGSFNVDWEHQTAPGEPEGTGPANNIQYVYPPDVYFWTYGVNRKRGRVFVVPDATFDIRQGTQAYALRHYTIDNGNIKSAYPEKAVLARPNLEPNHGWCTGASICGIDYVTPDEGDKYMEIGQYRLMQLCEEAERNDFTMAQTIQGLLGVSQNMVWACLDPDYNPLDRIPLYKEILTHRISHKLTMPTKRNIELALLEHKRFCKTWVWKHFRNLTPMVSSAAMVLVRKCMQVIPREYHHIGAMGLARILWRNERTSSLFHECVYHQICSNDTTKNGRNPSYKQMNSISNLYAQSYYQLIRELRKIPWRQVSSLDPASWKSYTFHPDIIDWYDIVRQFPEIHQHFREPDVFIFDQQANDGHDDDGNAAADWDEIHHNMPGLDPPGGHHGAHAIPLVIPPGVHHGGAHGIPV